MNSSAIRPAATAAARVILVALAAAGCAYGVSPSGRLAHHTIAIPMFVNESLEYGLDEAATRGVQQAFLDDNRMKVVNPAEAETVLRGTIRKYERKAYTFDEKEHVQEYKVEITLDLDFVEVASGKSLWHEPAFYVWASYDPAQGEDEEAGKTKAVDKAAAEVVARTIEGW